MALAFAVKDGNVSNTTSIVDGVKANCADQFNTTEGEAEVWVSDTQRHVDALEQCNDQRQIVIKSIDVSWKSADIEKHPCDDFCHEAASAKVVRPPRRR